MAAKDPKYGAITTELKDIPPDEPTFLIRGKDALSVTTLHAYRAFARFTGSNENFLESLDKVIKTFEDWQENNYIKNPD